MYINPALDAGPVMERQAWGGHCDQPFRLFSYPLPADVVPMLIAHVTRKEAASVPAIPPVLWPGVRPRRRVVLAYMSSDFGQHAVASLIGGLVRSQHRRRLSYVCKSVYICIYTYIYTHR